MYYKLTWAMPTEWPPGAAALCMAPFWSTCKQRRCKDACSTVPRNPPCRTVGWPWSQVCPTCTFPSVRKLTSVVANS